MNQISADVPRKHVAVIFRRKRVAIVYRSARCRGEPAAELLGSIQIILVVALLTKLRPLFAPFLWTRQREHRRRRPAMIGDVLRNLTYFKQRSARKVLHRHHDVPDMRGVLRDESIPKIVERRPELRRTRCR